MWGSDALVSPYNEIKQPRLSPRFWTAVSIQRSKTLVKGAVVWFRCRGWPMHQSLTYEVIKMKVKMLTCNAEHFHTCASNLAHVIARQSLKTWIFTDFSKRKTAKKLAKIQHFLHLARDSARHTARACLKVLGVARSNQNLHFDYLICGVLKHWSAPNTKSNDTPPFQ